MHTNKFNIHTKTKNLEFIKTHIDKHIKQHHKLDKIKIITHENIKLKKCIHHIYKDKQKLKDSNFIKQKEKRIKINT